MSPSSMVVILASMRIYLKFAEKQEANKTRDPVAC